jgi:mannose-1-phosphate guanylyltransferase
MELSTREQSARANLALTLPAALPTALTHLGYANDTQVVIITFDSNAERVKHQGSDPTVAQLSKISAGARGSTNMAGAMHLLQTVIKERHQDAVAVLVVSDGAVGDKDETVRAAEAAAKALKARPIALSLFLTRRDVLPPSASRCCS